MRHVPRAGRWRWLIWIGLVLLSGCTTAGGCDVDNDHPKVPRPPVAVHVPKGVPVPTTPRPTTTAGPTTTLSHPSPPSSAIASPSIPTTARTVPSRATHRGERSFRWRRPSLADPFDHFFNGFESGTQAWVAGLGAALLVILVTTVGVAITTTLTLALLPIILLEAVSAAVLAGFYGLVGIALALLFGFLAIMLKEMLFLIALVILTVLAGPLGWVALAPALAVVGFGARRSKRHPPTEPPRTSA